MLTSFLRRVSYISQYAVCAALLGALALLPGLEGAGAQAKTNFYVSPTGSDSNDGSREAPWQTLQHAAEKATPNSVVRIAAGTYKGFTINRGGSGTEAFVSFLPDSGVLSYEVIVTPVSGDACVQVGSVSEVVLSNLTLQGCAKGVVNEGGSNVTLRNLATDGSGTEATNCVIHIVPGKVMNCDGTPVHVAETPQPPAPEQPEEKPDPVVTLPKPETPQSCAAASAVPSATSFLYVDKDNPSCSNGGGGTEAQPLCSIQAAVSKAGPGTAIRIGESATPYNETIAITKSGTADKPIILEAAPGQKPVITNRDTGAFAAIAVQNVEHVVIRGLTLDGAGGDTPLKAIGIDGGEGKYAKGIVIENNTVLNWNRTDDNKNIQRVIIAEGTDGAIIRNNTVRDSRGSAVAVRRSYRAQISGNLITGVKCDNVQFSSGGKTTVWEGIKVGSGDGKGADGPSGHVIHDNVMANYDPNCRAHAKPSGGGIWCDGGVSHGEAYNNRIINVAGKFGVQIESRCHNWKVHDNLIADTKGNTKNNFQTRNAENTSFQNNISCSGARAFQINESPNTTITGNTISEAGDEIGTRSRDGVNTSINGAGSINSLSSGNTVTGNAAQCQNPLTAPLPGSCGGTFTEGDVGSAPGSTDTPGSTPTGSTGKPRQNSRYKK